MYACVNEPCSRPILALPCQTLLSASAGIIFQNIVREKARFGRVPHASGIRKNQGFKAKGSCPCSVDAEGSG